MDLNSIGPGDDLLCLWADVRPELLVEVEAAAHNGAQQPRLAPLLHRLEEGRVAG